MGSENGDDDEKPVRRVQISKPFYLGKYPVIQEQWQTVMGNNPSHFKGDPRRPVENVSWQEVQDFLRKLTKKETGKTCRLPTEAEWDMRAVRVRLGRIVLGTTKLNCESMRGTTRVIRERRIQWGSSSQTTGDFTTCMVMCGNGCRIGMRKITTSSDQTQILTRRDQKREKSACCAAVAIGSISGSPAAPAAAGTTRASAATTSVFGLWCVHETLDSVPLNSGL